MIDGSPPSYDVMTSCLFFNMTVMAPLPLFRFIGVSRLRRSNLLLADQISMRSMAEIYFHLQKTKRPLYRNSTSKLLRYKRYRSF